MTDKRGTGAEYGQEKLRERSAEVGAPESKKNIGKKKIISVVVAAAIAGVVMTTVILTSDKTPAEKVEAMSVEVGQNGIALTEPVKTQLAEAGVKTNADVVEQTSSTPENLPALEIAGAKNAAESPVISNPTEVLDATEDAAPTTEVKSSGEIVGTHQPTSGGAENNDGQDLSKFGYQSEAHDEHVPAEGKTSVNTVEPTLATSPIEEPAEEARPAVPAPAPETQIHLERVESPTTSVMMTGADLNYTGAAVKVEYKPQQQDTIYLYSTFAAKIFLLPTDKGSDINAYLSDEKGWQLKLLPGGILHVQRSENKSAWSQATDLFIVSGKRTYSLILQGVGDPSKRTDTLRYTSVEPENKTPAKSKK